jgi:putative transposase
LDSQSVKTTQVPGVRGYDSGKKVTGRKRHLLVDTLGWVIVVVVTKASLSDANGARQLFRRLGGGGFNLRRIWVDGGYRGKLLEWVTAHCWFLLVPVLRSDEMHGFVVLPGGGWWNARSPG